MASSPHANLQYALSSPHLPLTPQNPSLLSHNHRFAISLTQDTPPQNILNQTPITTARLDTPLEYTLNALSLFQKLILLFYENQLSPTSKLAPNFPSESNYKDPQNRPIQPISSKKAHLPHQKGPFYDYSNPTASSSYQTPTTLDKTIDPPKNPSLPNSSTNIKRQSPYNTRPSKQPFLTSVETTICPTQSSQNNLTHLQNTRKRSNISVLVSPSKKVAGVPLESTEIPNPS